MQRKISKRQNTKLNLRFAAMARVKWIVEEDTKILVDMTHIAPLLQLSITFLTPKPCREPRVEVQSWSPWFQTARSVGWYLLTTVPDTGHYSEREINFHRAGVTDEGKDGYTALWQEKCSHLFI